MLLPVRDAASTLEAALASLAAQTYPDLEVIAVDDGSMDGSHDVLLRASAVPSRLRVTRSPSPGIVAALNHAAALAQGELLARMDADDIAYPTRLARQVALLEQDPSLVACGTQIRYVPRRGLTDGARRYQRWINGVITPEDHARDLFIECPIPHPTLMVRREAFPGYRAGPFPEDYDLVLRLRGPIAKVPEVLLDWRDAPTRLSRTDARYSPDAFRRLKAQYLPALRSSASPVVVWGAGPVGKAFAKALVEAGTVVAAFVDLDPRKVGQTIHGAPVIRPQDLDGFHDSYIVAAVGQAGAREEIRAALAAMGKAEVRDWCAVA